MTPSINLVTLTVFFMYSKLFSKKPASFAKKYLCTPIRLFFVHKKKTFFFLNFQCFVNEYFYSQQIYLKIAEAFFEHLL